jgi:hypothetical protein
LPVLPIFSISMELEMAFANAIDPSTGLATAGLVPNKAAL